MTRRRIVATLAVATLAALIGGCGSAPKSGTDDDKPSGSTAPSSLTVDGRSVADDGRVAGLPYGTTVASRASRSADPVDVTTDAPWPAPPLTASGAIDDGPDPFAGLSVQPQPLPIEDDAETTREIDQLATDLRSVDPTQWERWMGARQRSPWQQDNDSMLDSMVKLTVERCGGAQTVASGVVLGAETVVTTVHAVESIAARVRVSPGGDDTDRLAAMVRYLDVDDDIAVLKVPGLKAPAMPVHSFGSGAYEWGFTYGVGAGARAGTLRRAPAIISTTETSLTVEQPDGFAQPITDRSVLPAVAAVDTGFSGGVVTATSSPTRTDGFGFAGLVRARVPFRSHTAAIVVPGRLVQQAISASNQLDPWFEHRPGGCPQWRR